MGIPLHSLVLCYFGTLGKANGLEALTDLIVYCHERGLDELHFVIAGQGSEKERLQQRLSGKEQVVWLDHMDQYEIRQLLAGVDVAYVSFAQYPVLTTNSPNKFFDALAAGKIVLLNVKGWLKELVDGECGYYVSPDQPEEAAERLLFLHKHPELVGQFSQTSRQMAEQQFDKPILCEKWYRLFESWTKTASGP